MKTTIIKHTTLSILLLLTVGLVGCGDDGDIYNKTVSKMLVGKWKLVKNGFGDTADDSFLIINADGTYSKEYYDPIKEIRIINEGIYVRLEDWAYDESQDLFSTVIQFGTPSTIPHYCVLKEKEMILAPKHPDGWIPFVDPREYYIKVK